MMSDSRNVKIDFIRNSNDQDKIIDMAKNDLDWHVRRAAVENIDDEIVLKDIVSNELTSAVSIKAMERISDKEFLYDVCLNHPDSHLRLACVNRISDESLFADEELSSLLEKMLVNDDDFHVLKSVCENPNLINQDALIEVAKYSNDEMLQRQAVKKITDEKILTDFALNDDDVFIRREAILNPNLVSLDVIFEIIRLDDDEFNRIMAIYKIPDKDSLLEIIFKKSIRHRLSEIAENTYFSLNDYFLNSFKNESDDYKRQVEVNFINEGLVLEEIILNDYCDDIRCDAIKNKNFTNQEILEELISSESDPKILSQVVSKIKNQDILAEFIKNHLQYSEVMVKAISKVKNMNLLRDLSNFPDSRIRLEAVKRISECSHNDKLLRDIALTENNEEICLEAIYAMDVRNDLIEVADKRPERKIRISALNRIKNKRLLDSYMQPLAQIPLKDLPFEESLKNMALNDGDLEIRRLATSKLNEKPLLDEIASSGDVNSSDAQKRLNSLFEDIKWIDNEFVLKELVKSSDKDISNMAQATLDDSLTWQNRIAEINNIDDLETLKDISLNDFNYLVRKEAEGKLEKMLFNIRLDEIGNEENQERLKAIVDDDSFSLEIRKRALLKINDKIVKDF